MITGNLSDEDHNHLASSDEFVESEARIAQFGNQEWKESFHEISSQNVCCGCIVTPEQIAEPEIARMDDLETSSNVPLGLLIWSLFKVLSHQTMLMIWMLMNPQMKPQEGCHQCHFILGSRRQMLCGKFPMEITETKSIHSRFVGMGVKNSSTFCNGSLGTQRTEVGT